MVRRVVGPVHVLAGAVRARARGERAAVLRVHDEARAAARGDRVRDRVLVPVVHGRDDGLEPRLPVVREHDEHRGPDDLVWDQCHVY